MSCWRGSGQAALAFIERPVHAGIHEPCSPSWPWWRCTVPLGAPRTPSPAKPGSFDGDTIEVAGERVRLYGIDAPESDQTCEWPGKIIPCGRLATTVLMDLTAGSEVICKIRENDRYGRWVAVCFGPDGFDIGRNMVHTVWALAYRR